MTTFVGIDLGLDGGIAAYVPELDHLTVDPMPTFSIKRNNKNKREIDARKVAQLLTVIRPTHVYLEITGAMPGQGTSSTYAFGRGVGMIEGVIAALGYPITYVAPKIWLTAMKVRGGKDGSRLRATQLFPDASHRFNAAKNDGLAEAALIARWAADNHERNPAK